MSWHFLQGQAEASWEGTCLDGAPSALLSLMPTPEASSSPVNATDAFHDSQSGMTSEPSTENRGEGASTSSVADSHAKTSAQLERVQELTESDPGCGAKWRESSARYDRATCGWKTHRCLFQEDLPWSLVTLPKWGMMRGGVLWERAMPVPRTGGTGVGFWPTASTKGLDGGSNSRKAAMDRGMWPTPRAGNPGSRPNGKGGKIPAEEVKIAEGLWERMPTHSANDWNGSSKPGQRRGQLTDPAMGVIPAGGSLNPTWVEWLMGWPLGWTSMDPMPESTWAAWQQAFRSDPTASGASGTDKSRQPL